MNQSSGSGALRILSGGAAQALVGKAQDSFLASSGHTITGEFGAVGLMRDKLLGGTAADVMILTQALIDELARSGKVDAASARPLGKVRTGVAVPEGEPSPRVDSPESLRAALRAASGIYFPDHLKATAGIHFMQVLRKLGLADEVADKLRAYGSGAMAMRAMANAAGAGETGLIGCTQITEILGSPGVRLVAPLPAQFELVTVYTAAVTSRSDRAEAAQELVDLLAGDALAPQRLDCGFE